MKVSFKVLVDYSVNFQVLLTILSLEGKSLIWQLQPEFQNKASPV